MHPPLLPIPTATLHTAKPHPRPCALQSTLPVVLYAPFGCPAPHSLPLDIRMNAPRPPPVVLHASDFQTPSAPVSVPMPFRVTCPPFFPLARQRHAAVGPFTLPWKAAILFTRCGVFSCGVAGFATLCSARRGANGCWQADAVCGRLEEMQRVQQVDELDGCSRAREGEFSIKNLAVLCACWAMVRQHAARFTSAAGWPSADLLRVMLCSRAVI